MMAWWNRGRARWYPVAASAVAAAGPWEDVPGLERIKGAGPLAGGYLTFYRVQAWVRVGGPQPPCFRRRCRFS